MKINTIELIISAVRESQYPSDKLKEFLLVGRSNVGKSSFINTIINRKNFARTSATPGKTQTLNFYKINDEFYLVDAPGYGFARVRNSLKQKFGLIMESYLKSRDNLQMVFLLIDFRHKPTNDDIMMYDYLKFYNIPVTIVCTKVDKVSKNNHNKNKQIIMKELNIQDEKDIILFSSVTKTGKNEIYDEIGKYIVDTFKEGETLEYILNCYTKNQKYELKFDYGAKDLLFIEKAEIQFNLYDDQDNHYLSKSKKQKVFDYIVLIIPVIKRNMSYDQVIDFIKLHKKEVDKIIFDLLNLKLKQREKKGLTIPINFLDFDKSKMVLTRQMQLVFTISVKEIPESIETKGAN